MYIVLLANLVLCWPGVGNIGSDQGECSVSSTMSGELLCADKDAKYASHSVCRTRIHTEFDGMEMTK